MNYEVLKIMENNYAVVTGCDSYLLSLIIPDEITVGDTIVHVDSISPRAFRGNPDLRFVTIQGIRHISDYAFEQCINLESLTLERVQSIGEYSFFGATALKKVTADIHLEEIKSFAFMYSSSLKEFDLGNVRHFGCRCFQGSGIEKADLSNAGGFFADPRLLRIRIPVGSIYIDPSGDYFIYYDKNGNVIDMDEKDAYYEVIKILDDTYIEKTIITRVRGELQEEAFQYCEELTDVVFSKIYNKLAENLFNGCISLKKIKLSDNIDTIDIGVFRNCTSLMEVSLPNNPNFKTYPAELFAGCTSLSELTIPKSIEVIDKNAFVSTSIKKIYVTWSTQEELGRLRFPPMIFQSMDIYPPQYGIYLYPLYFYGGNIRKPAELAEYVSNGLKYKLNSIDYTAELMRNDLTGSDGTDIIIPGTFIDDNFNYIYKTTLISSNCFTDNANLISVNLPEGIEIIKESFRNCTSLKSIVIPKSVEEIYAGCFSGCTGLASIDIKGSLESIGDRFFWGCTSLTLIKLPASLITFGEEAFQDCVSLKSIDIPRSVENIGSRCFSGCTNLVSVLLPYSLKTLQERTFENCTSLKLIDIPSRVETIGDRCFQNTSVEIVSLHEGLKAIGNAAFIGIPIISIVIPKSVKTIGTECFLDCTKLTEVWLSDGLKTLSYRAFRNCGSLKSIDIPSSVESVGDECFQNCLLGVVSFQGAELKTIGSNAFGDCAMKEFEMPHSVETIGAGCFSRCVNLELIRLSDGLKTLPEDAFLGCTSLSSIDVPQFIVTIERSCFYNCSHLESVILHEGLQTIGSMAFANCQSIVSLFIPKGLETIGSMAFTNCSAVVSLFIPNSVKNIKSEAFSNCTGIEDIYLEHAGPDLLAVENKAFANVPSDCIVHVPDEAVNNYNATWQGFLIEKSEKIVIDDIVYEISFEFFTVSVGNNQTYNGDEHLVIPEAILYNGISFRVRNIGAYAFLGNNHIVTAEIHVANIGDRAFSECNSLTSITLPEKLEVIHSGLLSNAKALKSIVIPKSVSTIEVQAFSGCVNLKEIQLGHSNPEELTVDNSAFYGITNSFVYVPQEAENNYGEKWQGFIIQKSFIPVDIHILYDENGAVNAGASVIKSAMRATVILNASPNYGYKFLHWTDAAGNIIQTKNPWELKVSQELTVKANFMKSSGEGGNEDGTLFYATLVFDETKGTVTGGGLHANGEEVTLSITPNRGYRFMLIINSRIYAISTHEYKFNITENTIIQVAFIKEEMGGGIQVPVYINVFATEGGRVTGNKEYELGAEVKLKASPNQNCFFDSWVNENNEFISRDANYTFILTEQTPRVYTAKFKFKGITGDTQSVENIAEGINVFYRDNLLHVTGYEGLITVTSLSGKKAAQFTGGSPYPVDLFSGIYIVNGKNYSGKIIVQ
ncbi:hypothetical protein Barb6_01094 [Bacteroidales bacterium Barb6]|nr:hypothetical protein Barb6_01094 [Bacteroidales bacterium Barb6]